MKTALDMTVISTIKTRIAKQLTSSKVNSARTEQSNVQDTDYEDCPGYDSNVYSDYQDEDS